MTNTLKAFKNSWEQEKVKYFVLSLFSGLCRFYLLGMYYELIAPFYTLFAQFCAISLRLEFEISRLDTLLHLITWTQRERLKSLYLPVVYNKQLVETLFTIDRISQRQDTSPYASVVMTSVGFPLYFLKINHFIQFQNTLYCMPKKRKAGKKKGKIASQSFGGGSVPNPRV